MKYYKIYTYLSFLLASLVLFSCEDRFDYSAGVVGDGESLVEATLTFKADVANLGSRSSGTAISTIDDLQIVIYNADEEKTLYKHLEIDEVSFKDDTDNPTSSTPDDYPQQSETSEDEDGNETTTDKDKTTEYATHKVKVNNLVLPYGKYYMYAVANLGKNLTKEQVRTIDNLKSVECEWKFDPMQYEYDRTDEDATPSGKQINAQMFGYFTSIDNTESRNTNGSAFDKEEPVIVINQPMVKLHSWIKRLASKVTIAYDGRGLHEGVYVYIHNVSIRQIPYKCYLGKNNDPQGVESVTPAYFDESIPKDRQSQALYYNQDGTIGSYNEYDPTEENGQKWMAVAKGVASGTDHPGIIGAYNHTNTDPALFFYENMKGIHNKNPKPQQPDSVGTNVKEDDWLGDYQDGIKYGTFIEVEAYYKCDIVPISQGPIRYRFMLGQNEEDNYDAIRNCHYKLTLGFRGYANQPDWHIEYFEPIPEIYAPPVFIPYTYNTSVEFPIRATGNPVSIEAELVENNWGPYDFDNDRVPPANGGYETNFDTRLLAFNWNRTVYDNNNGYKNVLNFPSRRGDAVPNSTNNYLYGRHKSNFKYLNEDGEEIDDNYYYVTPIWAGFLRLLQPTDYEDETTALNASLLEGAGDGNSYRSNEQLWDFRNYYINCPDSKEGAKHLGKRTFNIVNPKSDPLNIGRNSYDVVQELDAEGKVKGVSVIMKLWTQPKLMCGISGFSGNNPYEDYTRKAVIRITARYADGREIKKDIDAYQTERLVNPKAVWRSHELQQEGDEVFNVVLYKKDTDHPSQFEEVVSQGAWKATIKETEGFDGFISIGTRGGKTITGSTLSPVKFPIIFEEKNIGYNNSKCAIIEITYHGNTCVHNIYVRQGFHEPLKISPEGAYWSSYNLFSCGNERDTGYPENDLTSVDAIFTCNPIAFGSYFKRGNYYQAITAHNIPNVAAGFGPLGNPGTNKFELADRLEADWKNWGEIQGRTESNWHWTDNFRVTQTVMEEGEEHLITRTYRMPKYNDYNYLRNQEFGIGVLYCNGATTPATTTTDAYGFIDKENGTLKSHQGMRGIICYNPGDAHQIFFPIGTAGMGRRTIQNGQNGTLRYSSVDVLLTGATNALRPIPYNILNNAGSIYWMYEPANGHSSGWDMNYSDLNFNQYDNGITETPNGDALPIRLVIDRLDN